MGYTSRGAGENEKTMSFRFNRTRLGQQWLVFSIGFHPLVHEPGTPAPIFSKEVKKASTEAFSYPDIDF